MFIDKVAACLLCLKIDISLIAIDFLTNPDLFPDVLGLSCYLPLHKHFIDPTNKPSQANSPKITLMHGDNDEVIPVEYAKLSQKALQTLGYEVNFNSYNMGHEVSPEQIHAITNWLLKA